MTITAPNETARSDTPPPDLRRSAMSTGRRVRNQAAMTAIIVALILAILPLGMVVYQVILKGGGIMSLDFLTGDLERNPREEGGGMYPAIIGTLLITGAAALIAIPTGVLGAIYLNEYGKQSALARFIRTMADVMTGVPSIMMGLFIFIGWVLWDGEIFGVMVMPIAGDDTGFAGSLALACLMLPIVIRSSEEMLRLVPDELRQASAALGARKWRTTLTVVLPSAISGITSGSLLAIARAAGETAPLIMTVGLAANTNWDLFEDGNSTLPMQIWSNFKTPFEGAVERAWGAALTLITIVLVFTILARIIASRFAVKEGH